MSAAWNVKDWIERTTSFAQSNPQLAHRAYRAGAARIRQEAQKSLQKEALQTLANQLDVLALASRVQEVVGHPSDYLEPHFGADENVLVGDDPLLDHAQELGYEVAHEEAMLSAPPEPATDSFVEAAAQVHGAMEMQREAVPPVQVNPASAQFGVTMFGNSQIVQFTNYKPTAGTFSPYIISRNPTTIAQPEAPVIQWSGKDQETTACNVALGRGIVGAIAGTTAPGDLNSSLFLSGAGVYRPYWHALWGSGQGQPNEAYGDIGRGVQFTLGCSRLNVSVGMGAPPAGATSQSGFPGAMQLSGQMNFFSSARQSPVVFTTYVDSLAAAGNDTVGIPQFATTIEAIYGLTPANTFTFILLDFNGNFIANITPSQLRGNALVLDDEAFSVLVTNTGGSTGSCRIVFGLAL